MNSSDDISLTLGGGVSAPRAIASEPKAPVNPLEMQIAALDAMTEKILSSYAGGNSQQDWRDKLERGGMTPREFYNQTGRISAKIDPSDRRGIRLMNTGKGSITDEQWRGMFPKTESSAPKYPKLSEIRGGVITKPDAEHRPTPTGGIWAGDVGVRHGTPGKSAVLESPYGKGMIRQGRMEVRPTKTTVLPANNAQALVNNIFA